MPPALSREECLHYVARSPYGRVVYTSGALPAVSPVTFVVDGDVVLFDVDPASSLAQACHDSVLAFQVDDADVESGEAWSVTMTGRARFVISDGSDGSDGGDNLHSRGRDGGLVKASLLPELIAGERTRVRSVAERMVKPAP